VTEPTADGRTSFASARFRQGDILLEKGALSIRVLSLAGVGQPPSGSVVDGARRHRHWGRMGCRAATWSRQSSRPTPMVGRAARTVGRRALLDLGIAADARGHRGAGEKAVAAGPNVMSRWGPLSATTDSSRRADREGMTLDSGRSPCAPASRDVRRLANPLQSRCPESGGEPRLFAAVSEAIAGAAWWPRFRRTYAGQIGRQCRQHLRRITSGRRPGGSRRSDGYAVRIQDSSMLRMVADANGLIGATFARRGHGCRLQLAHLR